MIPRSAKPHYWQVLWATVWVLLLKAQRHSADVGRWARAQLKRIEAQLIDAGLIPDE